MNESIIPPLLETKHLGRLVRHDGRVGVLRLQNGAWYLHVKGDRKKYWIKASHPVILL